MDRGLTNLYDNRFYRHGFTAQRFEEMCQKLLMAESLSFYILDDSLGDFGIDGLDPESHRYFAIYFPERPRDDLIYQKIRDKMSMDLKKISKQIDTNNLHVESWVFVVPFDSDKRIAEHAQKLEEKHGIPIMLFGQTKLEQLLSKYSHLKQDYFGDYGDISDVVNRIREIAEGSSVDLDLLQGLIMTAEQNITEKIENRKLYLLRKNLSMYTDIARRLSLVYEKGCSEINSLLQHIQSFLVHILIQADPDMMLFQIINDEILQAQHDIAIGSGDKIFPGIIIKSRAYADVTLTVNSVEGIGYLQRKNYTWWLVSSLFLLSYQFHHGEADVRTAIGLEHFQALLGQRLHAQEVYEANYESVCELARKRRPDLYPYLQKVYYLVEEGVKEIPENIADHAPFKGPSGLSEKE